jgi:hemerythrin
VGEDTMIEWKDEYQTGIKEIDNHHHKLFEAVNRAYELSCKADEGVMNKKTVEKFINELTDITLHQFYIEEEFMLSIY